MSCVQIKPFWQTGEHSYHRRAINHDYFAPFIYHIIIKKAKGCPSFGSIIGDARITPGNPGCASVAESELGKVIAKAIIHLPYEYPIIKVFQFCVMPDHVHLLLQIIFRSDRHLDFYISSLIKRIVSGYSKLHGKAFKDENVFETGYCDKPLYDNRSLNGLFVYIRENPHRLAMRMQYPHFFQRVRKLKIAGGEFEAFGNLFLFRNPDKESVKISRKYTQEDRERKRTLWLSHAAEGTILVSPFISPAEKNIRTEAEALGANIILITHVVFGERFKPAAHDFELCTKGRLLIISMGLPAATQLSRAVCLQMNALAEIISQN